jgi:hypothetical protein
MAASHSTIPLPSSTLKPLNFSGTRDSAGRIRLVLGFERILRALICPRHSWNWPRPIRGVSQTGIDGYDAHQTCFKCNTERFYNTRLLQAGPLYRSRVPEPEGECARPWEKLLAIASDTSLGIRLRRLASCGSSAANSLRATRRPL